MYITKETGRQAAEQICNVLGKGIAVFDLSGDVIAVSSKMEKSTAEKFFSNNRICEFHYPEADQLLCYYAVADTVCTETQRLFAEQILKLSMDRQELLFQTDSSTGDKLYFINLLTTLSDGVPDSLSSFARKLNYHVHTRRCAILFQRLENSTVSYTEEIRRGFIEAVRSSPYYSEQDIFELLSASQMIVFKSLEEELSEEQCRNRIEKYAGSLQQTLEAQYECRLCIGVGSIYSNIGDLRSSFKEAAFLTENRNIFNDNDTVLFIDDHPFEYFSSLLPDDYWKNKITGYTALENNSDLSETLVSLSKNDMSFVKAARELGIHRNTLQKRYERIKELSVANPKESCRDRLEARQYIFSRNRKTILHAATNIQYNSIPHLGLTKFAENLDLLSNGRIKLDVHVLSNSGNNAQLLELLRGGSIDFSSFDFNVLSPYTNGKIKIFQLPFLFDSIEEAFSIIDSSFGKEIVTSLEDYGIRNLGYWSMGWRVFTSKNRRLCTPQDFNGLRIRIMHKDIMEKYLRSLGAVPIKMHYEDVYSALAQNLVDSQENPYNNIEATKLYKNQNYISELPMSFDVVVFVGNKLSIERLPDSQQEIIWKAAEMTNTWQHSTVAELNEKSKKRLEDMGIRIIPFNRSSLELWQSTAKPFYDSFESQDVMMKYYQAKRAYYEAGKYQNIF